MRTYGSTSGRAPAGLGPRQDPEGLAALAVAARRAPSPRPGRHPRVLCEPPLRGEALASRLLADDGCASVHRAWNASIAAFRRDRRTLERLVLNAAATCWLPCRRAQGRRSCARSFSRPTTRPTTSGSWWPSAARWATGPARSRAEPRERDRRSRLHLLLRRWPRSRCAHAPGAEGGQREHAPGQGTACRRFFFANAYLELFWVGDAQEAPIRGRPSDAALGTLVEAWRCRVSLRHRAPAGGRHDRRSGAVRRLALRAAVRAAGLAIDIARSTPLAGPEFFYLGFQRGRARSGLEPVGHELDAVPDRCDGLAAVQR